LYADTIIYGPAAWFTKTTLLLIFVRVFSPFRKIVIFIYAFIGAMLCYYLPVMIIKANICNPISALWNPEIALTAVCIDRVMLFYCDTIMSVLTDLVVLILPIPLQVYTTCKNFSSLRASHVPLLKIYRLTDAFSNLASNRLGYGTSK
jgi:hypothetical protein